MAEQWRPVVGFQGVYEVSNLGRVRSLSRVVRCGYGRTRRMRGRTLRSVVPAEKYPNVAIWFNGIGISRHVHILVAESFPEMIKGAGPWINHRNGNKSDNRPENLEWCTPSENNQHAYDNGLISKRVRPVIRLDDNKVFRTMTAAAKEIGAEVNHVWMACVGRVPRVKGFRFAYVQK